MLSRTFRFSKTSTIGRSNFSSAVALAVQTSAESTVAKRIKAKPTAVLHGTDAYNHISNTTGVTKDNVAKVMAAFGQFVHSEILEKGNSLTIVRLGTFKRKVTEPRVRTHLITKEKFEGKGSLGISFSASETLKVKYSKNEDPKAAVKQAIKNLNAQKAEADVNKAVAIAKRLESRTRAQADRARTAVARFIARKTARAAAVNNAGTPVQAQATAASYVTA